MFSMLVLLCAPLTARAEGWCTIASSCPDSLNPTLMMLVAGALAIPIGLAGAALLWSGRKAEVVPRRGFRRALAGNFAIAVLLSFLVALAYWNVSGRDNFVFAHPKNLLPMLLIAGVLQLGYVAAARRFVKHLNS